MESEPKNPPAELVNCDEVMFSRFIELIVRDVTNLANPNIEANAGEWTRTILRSVSRSR